jgi:L-ascorbate metabolism protein UlaG (beta-lactamase superfamily)
MTFLTAVLSLTMLAWSPESNHQQMEVDMSPKITWLGHASFRIEGSQTIYIDPWKLKGSPPKADIILITHEHHDHCSPEDVAKVLSPETVIVTEKDAASKLEGNIQIVAPGDTIEVKGVNIVAIPAYNITKQFHPKSKGWVGFIFVLDGTKYYHSGDTDCIPEMENLRPDIAMIPVSGTYVMDVQEALEAVELIKPQKAIPMHWGEIVGCRKDAEAFQKQASCEVEIMTAEP